MSETNGPVEIQQDAPKSEVGITESQSPEPSILQTPEIASTDHASDAQQVLDSKGPKELLELYADGKLDSILGNVKRLSRPAGRFTDAEMSAALERLGAGEGLDQNDEKILGLLGRLYISQDKLESAVDVVAKLNTTQKAADARQQEMEGQDHDVLDLKFGNEELQIEYEFMKARKVIEAKYAEQLARMNGPAVQGMYEDHLASSRTILEGFISSTRKKIDESNAQLVALRAVDDGDFKVKKRIEEEESRLAEDLRMLDGFSASLETPESKERFWKSRIRQDRMQSIIDASKQYKPRTWQQRDHMIRFEAMRDSSDPENVRLFNDVANRHYPLLSDAEAYYNAPVLGIMLRNRLEKAISTNDPRLEVYTKRDGKRITGKLERMIDVQEQAKEAGYTINLLAYKDLLTPEEVRLLDQYNNRRESELSQAA